MTQYTFWVACCFTINYVIGSGFLTLPWAFNASGLVLASVVLTVITAVSLMTSWKLLEVISRANALVNAFGVDAIAELASPPMQQSKTAAKGNTSSASATASMQGYSAIVGAGADGDADADADAEADASPRQIARAETGAGAGAGAGAAYSPLYGSVTRHPSGKKSSIELKPFESSGAATLALRAQAGAGVGADGSWEIDTLTSIMPDEPSVSVDMRQQQQQAPHPLGDRKFEIAELCGIFLGPLARRAYIVTISVYFYGSLWAYSTVFAHAWSGFLPIAGLSTAESYYVYLAWWAVMECTWCLFELDEQIVVQVVLAVGRVLMVGVMIATVLTSGWTDSNSFNLSSGTDFIATGTDTDTGKGAAGGSDSGSDSDSYSYVLWNAKNLFIILPIGFYANVMHHSVPTLVRPVVDKRQAGSIFAVSICVAYCAYMTMALTVSFYFGKHANASSNLNWLNYLGQFPSLAQLRGEAPVPLYARLIALFVVIFPSIDVASAFPLNAVTLGNNLMAAYYGTEAMPEAERSAYKKGFFRLLAAVPPVIAAAVIHDLGPITAYTGLTGILIACVVPAVLSYSSENALRARNMPVRTCFSVPHTGGAFSLVVAAAGLVSIAYIFCELVISGVPKVLA